MVSFGSLVSDIVLWKLCLHFRRVPNLDHRTAQCIACAVSGNDGYVYLSFTEGIFSIPLNRSHIYPVTLRKKGLCLLPHQDYVLSLAHWLAAVACFQTIASMKTDLDIHTPTSARQPIGNWVATGNISIPLQTAQPVLTSDTDISLQCKFHETKHHFSLSHCMLPPDWLVTDCRKHSVQQHIQTPVEVSGTADKACQQTCYC